MDFNRMEVGTVRWIHVIGYKIQFRTQLMLNIFRLNKILGFSEKPLGDEIDLVGCIPLQNLLEVVAADQIDPKLCFVPMLANERQYTYYQDFLRCKLGTSS